LPSIRSRDLIPAVRDLPVLAGLYVAYSLAVWIGLQWAVTRGAGSPIWPAAGIAFAGLMLGGPRLWPAVFLGRLSVALLMHAPQPWWADIGLAAASAASSLVPALIIGRLGGLDRRLASLTDIARLILLGGLLGGAISALGVLAVWASGVPTERLLGVVENWLFGYFVAVLLVTPLLLAFARRREWRVSATRVLHLALCLTAVAAVAVHVFLQPAQQPVGSWQLFPVLVWAALAFSVPGASLALAVVAVIATWAAMAGIWPQPGVAADAGQRILMAQEFLAASGLTVLVLAAVADERRGKDQIAQREQRLLAIAVENKELYEAAQREIAERTRAEAHQRLLINELNHRVKNTLATVQSIAAQTQRSADDPRQSYEAFTERLMALSRAHDVLTARRWEGAELRDVVDGAIQPFDAGGGRFKVSGPSVWLEPQAALALAMALHELATNAAKYGALSVAAGRVSLAWSVKRDGDDGIELALTWREAQGPKVTPPSRKGFGSRLLERGLAAELNGTGVVDYRPDGLVCAMTAKLPAIDGAAQAAAE
jgi:two-component sensor histidine kinase/integral membrane sensor domain MASE1